jgi:hypothetical protein
MVWKREQGDQSPDETPTDPAPAVHSYHVPKFPPDPKLPSVDEATFVEADYDYPRESGHFETRTASTFRSAPVVRHVYRPVRRPRVRSA